MKNCTLRALPRWRGFEHEASLRGRPCRDARACMEDSRTVVIVRYAADLNEKGAADLATQKHFIAAQLAVRGIGWKTVLHNYAAKYKTGRIHSITNDLRSWDRDGKQRRAAVESGTRIRRGGQGGVDSARALPNTDKEEASHAAGISRRTIYRQLRNTGSSRPSPSPPRARPSRRTNEAAPVARR